MKQLATDGTRWYRVSVQQGYRYFPISRKQAESLLAANEAQEVPYLPFSRPDLWEAYKVAQTAIKCAQGG
jgi:hypothetical protein